MTRTLTTRYDLTTWDLFTRATAGLFTPAWLAGASVLPSQNDTDDLPCAGTQYISHALSVGMFDTCAACGGAL